MTKLIGKLVVSKCFEQVDIQVLIRLSLCREDPHLRNKARKLIQSKIPNKTAQKAEQTARLKLSKIYQTLLSKVELYP